MNARRLLLLSAICLTMGVAQAPAQGFLKKLKDKGTQLVNKVVKDAAPEPVKKVADKVNKTEAKVRGVKNKASQRSADVETARVKSFHPAKKIITVKFCEGVGPKQWYGRVGGTTPQPPAQCPKQPEWSTALPVTWYLDNARLAQEHEMINKWMSDGKPSCEPVLVRREANDDEIGGRVRAVEKVVKLIIANDPEEADQLSAALEEDMFKHAVNSDLAPLYRYMEPDVVAWLKTIDRTTKTLSVEVSAGNSSDDVMVQQGEMWFKVNTARQSATLVCLDHDQSVGKDYTVPASITYSGRTFKVTEIGATAFADMKVRSVTLSEGLKSIGRQAFTRTGLTSINIPSTVTFIDYRAFAEMPALKSVTVPSGVEKIGIAVFAEDKALATASVEASVTEIGNSMFSGCTSLTKVTLPQRLTKLPDCTFEGCKSLAAVSLPDGITLIDQNAFKGTAITQVPLPASLTTIESGAFEACNRLTSVNIPRRVTLEFNAFKDCKSLKKAAVGSQYRGDTDEIYGIFMGCPFVGPRMTSVPACVTFND